MIERQIKNGISEQAALCWRLVLLLLLLLSSALQTMAFVPDLDRLQQAMALLHMLGGFLLLVGFQEYKSRRHSRLTALVLLLPLFLLFLLLGPRQVLTGLERFLQRLLRVWNRRFDFGLPVPDNAGTETVPAFSRFLFFWWAACLLFFTAEAGF